MEKHEIGVMSAKEIKSMASRNVGGLEYWTDERIEEERKKAQEYCKKVLKEEPHLYKKGQGIDD